MKAAATHYCEAYAVTGSMDIDKLMVEMKNNEWLVRGSFGKKKGGKVEGKENAA
jgi:hypothetical protein